MASKYVYVFGGGKAEGSAADKNLLGGKGANLAEMAKIGLPIPAGFTLSTEVCTYYYEHGRTYPKTLAGEVKKAIERSEKVMGAKFGDAKNPLLFSVRSGARASMPGMMETILNIGLNDKTVEALAAKSNNPRFAYDCYRRFIQMYSGTAMHADKAAFEHAIDQLKHDRKVSLDTELSVEDLKELVATFKAITLKETGKEIPSDPMEQLWGGINAVFGSWQIDKARTYRRINNIPDHWGTAVNVCSMVFGNLDDNSATGVAFTRNPSTGEKLFFGEYLINAQGEDVVAGIRTPAPINKTMAKPGEVSLEEVMPKPYKELVDVYKKLEKHYKDMQDIEFTIQQGKLWMLQTRNGKRTGFAAVKIAADLVLEGLLKPEEALRKVDPIHLTAILAPILDLNQEAKAKRVGKGINASPGGACGRIALDPDVAQEYRKKGVPALLVRVETSPEDIGGMDAAVGILTARGGATSHAAVVARGMGKPCVCGVDGLKIDYKAKSITIGGKTLNEGDFLSINGTLGVVYAEKIDTAPSEVIQVLQGALDPKKSELYRDFALIMEWADATRTLGVRTNCDTPEDARLARALGAQGIGLCRTEHMFFAPGRIKPMREMILADTEVGRRKALAKLLPFQRDDFRGIFEAMEGHPVTIRLLDPPLHEFVPHTYEAQKGLAVEMGIEVSELHQKVEALHEFNPMLGHRGCRLGITYPEITEMQSQAIFEAAADLVKRGKKVLPEVMVPLVGNVKELKHQKDIILRVAKEVMAKEKVNFEYMIGTMIEVPRAALTAAKIAAEAEFFSFGTNDLTQMTMGFSRDDAGRFIAHYMDDQGGKVTRILEADPFQTIDVEGVGQLMRMGVEGGRSVNPKLKCGICGEHGGDPETILFCHAIGLNYVSASPYRVPVGRLVAAQAAILNPIGKKGAKKAAAKPAKKTAAKKAVAKKAIAAKPAKKAAKPVKAAAAKPAKKAVAKKAAPKPAKKAAKKGK